MCIRDSFRPTESPAYNHVLTFLIATTELATVHIELTLLVDGMVVSGRPLHELTYIGKLANLLWETMVGHYEQQPMDRDRAVALREQKRAFQPGAVIGSFVHIAQVTISRGAENVSHVALWRATAEDISSWAVHQRQPEKW